MPSREAILQAFASFKAAGLRPPQSWEDPAVKREVIPLWLELAAGVSDEALLGAAAAYLRTGEPWWPTPGQLLTHLHERRAAAIDDADMAWGYLTRMVSAHGTEDPPGPMVERVTVRKVIGRKRDGARFDEVRVITPARSWDWPEEVGERMRVAVQALGGWASVCRLDSTDPAARAAFRNAYRGARDVRALVDDTERTLEAEDRAMLDWLRVGLLEVRS